MPTLAEVLQRVSEETHERAIARHAWHRAHASDAYILLSSKDPIQTAFDMAKRLKKLSITFPQLKGRYRFISWSWFVSNCCMYLILIGRSTNINIRQSFKSKLPIGSYDNNFNMSRVVVEKWTILFLDPDLNQWPPVNHWLYPFNMFNTSLSLIFITLFSPKEKYDRLHIAIMSNRVQVSNSSTQLTYPSGPHTRIQGESKKYHKLYGFLKNVCRYPMCLY